MLSELRTKSETYDLDREDEDAGVEPLDRPTAGWATYYEELGDCVSAAPCEVLAGEQTSGPGYESYVDCIEELEPPDDDGSSSGQASSGGSSSAQSSGGQGSSSGGAPNP